MKFDYTLRKCTGILGVLRLLLPFSALIWTIFLGNIAFHDVSIVNNHVSIKVSRFVCDSPHTESQENLDNAFAIATLYFQPWIKVNFALCETIVDDTRCHLTFAEARRLTNLSRSNVVNLIISESIAEENVAGFAPVSGRHTFIGLQGVSADQELAILIAHEIGHALSLKHTFAGLVDEYERADYLAYCPGGNLYRNIMDYLPLRCEGDRYFFASQLSQMKWNLFGRKIIAMIMAIASVLGMAIAAFECYVTCVKIAVRRMRHVSRLQYDNRILNIV